MSGGIVQRPNRLRTEITLAKDAYQLSYERDPSIGTREEWLAAFSGEKKADYTRLTYAPVNADVPAAKITGALTSAGVPIVYTPTFILGSEFDFQDADWHLESLDSGLAWTLTHVPTSTIWNGTSAATPDLCEWSPSGGSPLAGGTPVIEFDADYRPKTVGEFAWSPDDGVSPDRFWFNVGSDAAPNWQVIVYDADLAAVLADHVAAPDPHGDRAYSDQELSDHVSDLDPHGDRAYADGQIDNHLAAVDPHGDRAYTDDALDDHVAADDPHGDRAYADALVVGMVDDRGNFDASVNRFPDATDGGSGPAGAVLRGDLWIVSSPATLGALSGYPVGTNVRALIDAPGQTAANWAITAIGYGYAPENSANKQITGPSIETNKTSTTLYASIKALYDWATGLFFKSADAGGAAFLDVGTVPGTVAAGDDPRFTGVPAVVGSANTLFLNADFTVADNLSLSVTPTNAGEIEITRTVTDATSPVFIERFVSGPLGRDNIAAGTWEFTLVGDTTAPDNSVTLKYRVNRRRELYGMTGTWSGSGPIRTFTVTGGAPFVPGDATGTILTASLVETPNQSGWVTNYISATEVEVKVSDEAYVNEVDVELTAMYYFLFQSETEPFNTVDSPHTNVTIQPEFALTSNADRLVLAVFAHSTSSTPYDVSLCVGGLGTISHIDSPLALSHDDLYGVEDAGAGVDHGHITDQIQTIYGAKSFDTPIAVTSGGTGANNAADARANLELGDIATRDASEFDPAGSAADAETAAKAYADDLVVGLVDDRGNYDALAAAGAFPTTGGSGDLGAVLKGDLWIISVAATAGALADYPVGCHVRALDDTPGQNAAKWAVTAVGFGYAAENAANKLTTGPSIETNKTSQSKYPSIMALYDWATGLFIKQADAVSADTPDKVVKRGANGEASFQHAAGGSAVVAFSPAGNTIQSYNSGNGSAVMAISYQGEALVGLSTEGVGLRARTSTGSNHAEFGATADVVDGAFIARVNGALGWWRRNLADNAWFTGRVAAPANLEADVEWLLPPEPGTLARVEDLNFLPDTGGTLSGDLSINGKLTTRGIVESSDVSAIVNSANPEVLVITDKTILQRRMRTATAEVFMLPDPAMHNGQSFTLWLHQVAAGNPIATSATFQTPALAPNNVVDWGESGAFTCTDLNDKVDIITFVCLNNKWYGNAGKGYTS